MLQHLGMHKGYDIYYHGISYQCPSLRLYGYATDLALYRAINRVIKRKGK